MISSLASSISTVVVLSASVLSAQITGNVKGTVLDPSEVLDVTNNPVPAGSAGAPNGPTSDVQPISAYAAALGPSQPIIGNYGNLWHNVSRLNGQSTFDWNFYKYTPIHERVNLQFRCEMYNLFNRPTFRQVNRTVTSPSFGQYTDTALNSRNIQLALRLIF